MDVAPLIEKLREQLPSIEQQFGDPKIIADRERFTALSREYQRLKKLLESWDRLQKCKGDLADNREMLSAEDDEEFREVIQTDISQLEVETEELDGKLMMLVLPPGENDSRNSIMEIRPAAGGDEAALFSAELFRMYTRFAESRGWKIEILHRNETDLGGIKEVAFDVQGEDCFRQLQFEGGVHRVQRIPATETSGRIHTSTVTVAVLPEANEIDVQLAPEDLDIKVTRSSGPGGQSVNTTDSAVIITHIPSGITVQCQNEKSQHKNKAQALRVLRSRLLEQKQREEQAKYAAERKSQVGTGDRSERIRTYNFPQNRVTDHRFNISWHNLPDILEGNLETMFANILSAHSEIRLEAELEAQK